MRKLTETVPDPSINREQWAMEARPGHIPPGPAEPYDFADDLLEWIGRQFQSFGDVFRASVFGVNVYAVRNIELAHHVLVENWQNYVKGHMIGRVALLLGSGLMVSEGDLWKRQRRMIQPSFHREAVSTWTDMITKVNLSLLDKWRFAGQRNESVNITRDVSGMALEVILRFVFGKDYERVAGHFELLSREQARDVKFARQFHGLRNTTLEVINERRKHSTMARDGLGALMQARDPHSGQLMEDCYLIDEVMTLIVAGHETTASTLSWVWYLVSQHPEFEQRLCEELRCKPSSDSTDLPGAAYARQIIDEAMRLYPAGWLLYRKALNDDRLGEYFVPAGTEIYVPPYFIHRNPAVWEEPDHFDPDRFQADRCKRRHRLATIPFSAGPRNCIGEHFARLEMQIHLLTIAKELRLRYVSPRPIELDAGVNLRCKFDFVMYPELRSQADASVQ